MGRYQIEERFYQFKNIIMKGNTHFSKEAYEAVKKLLLYLRSGLSREEQKVVRNRIRGFGFYLSDFGISTAEELEQLRLSGRITVEGYDGKAMPVQADRTVPKTFVPSMKPVDTADVVEFQVPEVEWNDIESLKRAGFQGFVPVRVVQNNAHCIPLQQGVYLIIRNSVSDPEFLETGSGGFFKGKNPNVSIADLQANWVENTKVVYIGKAGGIASSATLCSRLKQLFQFGSGKAVGHWGGRLLWQLADAQDLLVAWLPLEGIDAREFEARLIQAFRKSHGGRLPFANLTD